jgi:hypothetical protein
MERSKEEEEGKGCTHPSTRTRYSAVEVALEADRVACVVTAGLTKHSYWFFVACDWSSEDLRGEESRGREADCGEL